MKAKWIHKWSRDIMDCMSVCGIETTHAGNQKWKKVTCPKCLAKRPPFKLSEHLPKDPGNENFSKRLLAAAREDRKAFDENNASEEIYDERVDAPPITKGYLEADKDRIADSFEREYQKEVDDVRQSFEEISTIETTPFDKWEEWFKLCCDHSFSPQPHEVWDGAIDTLCAYLTNEMCSELGLDEIKRILDKTKKKFKTS